MPAERQLADEGARPARPHHRQGRQRDRHPAGGLLPPRRLAAEAADPARGRRDDRHARIDGEPGHLATNISPATAASTSSNISSPAASRAMTAATPPRSEAVKSRIKALIAAEDPDADPLRRPARRDAEGRGLRHRPAHRRQISRGDRPRLLGPAAPAEGDRAGGLSRSGLKKCDGAGTYAMRFAH